MNEVWEVIVKIKKLAVVLMSTLIVLGLTACGSQNTQSSQGVQNNVSAVPPANESTPVESTPASDQSSVADEAETTGETVIVDTDAEEMASEDMTTEDVSDILTDISAEEVQELSEEENGTNDTAGKILVVYYSATGTTENVADHIAAATGADLFKLQPVNPYSSDDLNWTDESSRVVYEHDNPDARTVELVSATVDNWASYDTVFIGYPIWWHIAAWPVDGFVTANDFTGKTVIPFCTSSSSDLGESGELLAEAAGTGNWMEGERFSSGASAETVQAWVNSLGLN